MKSILLSLVLMVSASAHAQGDFPNKPIRFLAPSSVGGGGDMVARLLANGMSKQLKQPMVVENNAGASGTIAIGQLAHSKPDGYTIGLGTMSSTTLAPAIFPKLSFDLNKDLMPIGGIGTSPIMMVATNDVPANNLKRLSQRLAQPVHHGLRHTGWGVHRPSRPLIEVDPLFLVGLDVREIGAPTGTHRKRLDLASPHGGCTGRHIDPCHLDFAGLKRDQDRSGAFVRDVCQWHFGFLNKHFPAEITC